MARFKKDRKIELLEGVPLFSACQKKDLQNLAALVDEVDFAKGAEIVKQGSVGLEFYVVADGTADVKLNGKKIAALKTGDFFGEMALLDKGPRSATVVATSDITAFVLTANTFHMFVKDTPGVAVRLLAGVAERLRKAEKAPTWSKGRG